MGKIVQLQNKAGNTIEKRQGKNAEDKKYRYKLTNFKSNYYIGRKPVYNSKCNFEVHSAGLMLSGDFCNHYNHISILAQEVISVTLVHSKETTDTFYKSPTDVLSKIGFPKRIARYFSSRPSADKISETKILIEGKEQRLELLTSGYGFEKLKRHFRNRGYRDKLVIKSEDRLDSSGFKNTIPEAKTAFIK